MHARLNPAGKVVSTDSKYKIEMVHIYSAGSDIIVRRVNELGSDGWEIISTIFKSGDTNGVIFKRQKPK